MNDPNAQGLSKFGKIVVLIRRMDQFPMLTTCANMERKVYNENWRMNWHAGIVSRL
jgi:hypothetical protein